MRYAGSLGLAATTVVIRAWKRWTKRAQKEDGEVDGWVMKDEEEERSKLTLEEITLEAWIQENEKVKTSSDKIDDTVKKWDRKGKSQVF